MMKQKLALLLTALLLLTGCSSGGSGDTADGQDDGELETIDRSEERRVGKECSA